MSVNAVISFHTALKLNDIDETIKSKLSKYLQRHFTSPTSMLAMDYDLDTSNCKVQSSVFVVLRISS